MLTIASTLYFSMHMLLRLFTSHENPYDPLISSVKGLISMKNFPQPQNSEDSTCALIIERGVFWRF